MYKIIVTVRKFVGRHDELQMMVKALSQPGFKLYPIYGRRRIGKTALIKEFISSHGGIYFLCTTGGVEKNLEYFSQAVSDLLEIPKMDVSNFREVFENAKKMGYTRGIIAMDEFPALIQSDEGVLGDFQFIVDEILSDTEMMLILCGSSVGMMENYVLDKESPLYGRRTAQMNLGPLRQSDIRQFLAGFEFKEQLDIQAMVGGVPRYLMEFTRHKTVKNALSNSFFASDGYMYREGYLLLKDELRDPDTYTNILESIAMGNTKVTEIANASYLQAKDLPKYLNVLFRLGLVARENPITERNPRTKKSLYSICDDYFRFYFRFVFPHRREIEYLEPDVPLRYYRENANHFMGPFWEDYVRGIVRERLGFSHVGRWWHGGEEIDIVGILEKQMLLCEVKWTNRRVGRDVVESLFRKSDMIKGYEKHSKRYLIVSRSGFTSGAVGLMEAEGIEHWDLNDVRRMVA